MTTRWTVNPKTGRRIKIGGPTHKKLKLSKKTKKDGRGSRTRGWKKAAPKRGKQRNAMKRKCGNRCFLQPSRNAFPVCTSSCKVDCRGVQSAYNRARQYHYPSVAKKALSLRKKKCGY